MAIKPTNIINPNISSTYNIDQQIESKEESERKNDKMVTNYYLQNNGFINPVPHDGYGACTYVEENGEETKNENQEYSLEHKFEDFEHLTKEKEKHNYRINNNKIDEIPEINKELILSNFDDKILNEMTLIYNIENYDQIKIFGAHFVYKNINNCYILINDQKNILCEIFELNESQKNEKTLEIKLIENKTITDMSYMFHNCTQLKTLSDRSHWNTENIINMSAMFFRCESLDSIPDISKWNTKM